ncbi:MAG: hypothetical protein MUC62_07735 [Candidatus Thermoplasmatota archaeon]|jgi:hypothetical protein|nr:hypothetical protein [Candidatus Thermoplasmatota archaeon]
MTVEEPTSIFFDNLNQMLESTLGKVRSTTHKFAPIQDDVVNYIEGSFYSNLIRLYENNLNDKFFTLVKMKKDDKKALLEELSPFFDRAKVTFESTYNEGEVDFQLYQEFRRTIYEFGDDAYWLLLGVEKYADVIRCEHRIIQFKNDLISLIK